LIDWVKVLCPTITEPEYDENAELPQAELIIETTDIFLVINTNITVQQQSTQKTQDTQPSL